MKLFRVITCALLAVAFGPGAFGVTVDAGVQGTESGLQTRREGQWDDFITEIDPRQAPFLHLFLKLKRKKSVDPEFNLFQDEDLPGWTRVNGALTSGDATVVVDDASIFGASYRFYVPRTEEIVKVGASDGATQLTGCTRGYGASNAAAINDDEWILNLGEIITEGRTDHGLLKTTRPVLITNYVEEFEEAFGVTGTMDATKMRGPAELDRVQLRATNNFRRKIERALRVGIADEIGSAPTTERHTGGFEQFVSTNVFDLDGAISEPDLMYIAERVFRYGSEDKLVLCGRNARLQIDLLGMENTVVSATDERNTLGMEITKVRTSAGTLNFTTDHFLENGLADTIHIVDLQHASLAVLRDIQLRQNMQNKKEDRIIHEWMATLGLYIANEKAHAVIKGCADVG